jgi:hypothetical protein
MLYRIVFAFSILLVSMAGLVSGPAIAHQQKAAITKILFNPRTKNIEVMHRFYLHDAEHAVRQIFGKGADILGSDETKASFGQYVTDRFNLTTQAGEPLPLEFVGFEVERNFFWVYQETPIAEGVTAINIQHNALRDVWPQQVNTVNIEGLAEIKTATFFGSVEVLTLDLN